MKEKNKKIEQLFSMANDSKQAKANIVSLELQLMRFASLNKNTCTSAFIMQNIVTGWELSASDVLIQTEDTPAASSTTVTKGRQPRPLLFGTAGRQYHHQTRHQITCCSLEAAFATWYIYNKRVEVCRGKIDFLLVSLTACDSGLFPRGHLLDVGCLDTIWQGIESVGSQQ